MFKDNRLDSEIQDYEIRETATGKRVIAINIFIEGPYASDADKIAATELMRTYGYDTTAICRDMLHGIDIPESNYILVDHSDKRSFIEANTCFIEKCKSAKGSVFFRKTFDFCRRKPISYDEIQRHINNIRYNGFVYLSYMPSHSPDEIKEIVEACSKAWLDWAYPQTINRWGAERQRLWNEINHLEELKRKANAEIEALRRERQLNFPNSPKGWGSVL
jgi:hypothetical protein